MFFSPSVLPNVSRDSEGKRTCGQLRVRNNGWNREKCFCMCVFCFPCGLLKTFNHATMPICLVTELGSWCFSTLWGGIYHNGYRGRFYIVRLSGYGYKVRFYSQTIWLCIPSSAIYWLWLKQSYLNFLCLSFLYCTCGIREISERTGVKVIWEREKKKNCPKMISISFW